MMRSHTHGSRNSVFVLSIRLAISYRSIDNNGGSLVACMCVVVVVVVVKTIEYLFIVRYFHQTHTSMMYCVHLLLLE
jgi:hypothetical protein